MHAYLHIIYIICTHVIFTNKHIDELTSIEHQSSTPKANVFLTGGLGNLMHQCTSRWGINWDKNQILHHMGIYSTVSNISSKIMKKSVLKGEIITLTCLSFRWYMRCMVSQGVAPGFTWTFGGGSWN